MAKPRGETRDRAFGGKAGIWLKRKKQSAVHPNDDRKKVTPPSISNAATDDLVASQEHTVEESTLNIGALTSTKRTMVGWDDVRCRPVYRETASSGASSSTSSTASLEEEEEQEPRDDELSSDDDHAVEEERRDDVPSSLLTTRNETGSRKTRAYGSRKRKPSSTLLSTHQQEPSTRKRHHVSKAKKASTASYSTVMTPMTSRTAFDLATPQTGAGNICAALNSDAKASAPLGSAVSSKGSTQIPKSPKQSKMKGLVTMQRRKKPSAKPPPAIPPSLSQLDFVDETVSQPSSTTSLVAARAFFERLDAQQTLTLDASGTPRKNCVRTRRAVIVDSDSMQQEYQEYAAATKATGVEPLSVELYAVNRSSFFRTGEMYDGFLDG